MLEMLLHGESKKSYAIPEFTGPGPQALMFGDGNIGFFGEVSSSELITGSGLANLTGVTQGILVNDVVPWLKFVLDGKILFIPKVPIRISLSWNQLNSSNVVYGDRTIVIEDYWFSISLPKGANADPAINPSGDDVLAGEGSQWNRLFYPISSTITLKDKEPKWSLYTDSELHLTFANGDGRCTWCQEKHSYGPGRMTFRGDGSVMRLHHADATSTDRRYGWRPVLELINTQPPLHAPTALHYSTDYIKATPIHDWVYMD